MIAVDTNLLLYAHRSDSDLHGPARKVLTALVEGPATFALPWSVVHEYLCVSTSRSRFEDPNPPGLACEQMDRLLRRPNVVLLSEARDHWSRLRPLIERAEVRGPLAYDARIAATCVAHGVTELWTADRDFGRFPELKTRNPLVE